MRHLIIPAIATIAMAIGSAATAAEPFADMLKRVPDNANTLIMVDLAALRASPMGVKQGWEKQNERDFYGGISGIPPAVQQLLVASYLDPSTLSKSWDVTLAQLDTAATPVALARREGGSVDPTNPELVASSRNAFFTVFEPKLVGARCPANRQEMVRWQRFAAKNDRPVVTDYLQQVVKDSAGKHIVLAIDITDVLDAPGVKERLKKAKALERRNVNLEDLAKLIVTIKGISLSVTADSTLKGEIRVEYGVPPNDLAGFGRALTVEALSAAGLVDTDDMEKWDQKIEGNTMVLRGGFTEKGLRALLLPMTPPSLSPSSLVDQIDKANTPTDPKAVASLRYFRSVKSLLDELQDPKNNKTHSRISYLYKEYARKIDELPLLNVDPELLNWGASVSGTVRELANQALLQSRSNTALQANVQEGVNIVPDMYQRYGAGYGWSYYASAPGYQWNSNRTQITNMMAAGNLTKSARRQETWKNINGETVKVRQAMVGKYNVEF